MFTPVLNEYNVIIMIMSLFFSLLRVSLHHCSALSFSGWTLMLSTAGDASGLIFSPTSMSKRTKVWRGRLPHIHPCAPLPTSPKLFLLHLTQILLAPSLYPHDPGGARMALQWNGVEGGGGAWRNRRHHSEPKWHVAFSSTDTSETPEGGAGGLNWPSTSTVPTEEPHGRQRQCAQKEPRSTNTLFGSVVQAGLVQ